MAKKRMKVEKETRRLIEGISDLIKRKREQFKFKTKKKKVIKRVKLTCVHWTLYKGKEHPAVKSDINDPSKWRCGICGKSFPKNPSSNDPAKKDEYRTTANKLLEFVNQSQFFAVFMGGDKDDTKLFLQLKSAIPRYIKVHRRIMKQLEKHKLDNNKSKSNVMNQFDSWDTGYSYR